MVAFDISLQPSSELIKCINRTGRRIIHKLYIKAERCFRFMAFIRALHTQTHVYALAGNSLISGKGKRGASNLARLERCLDENNVVVIGRLEVMGKSIV